MNFFTLLIKKTMVCYQENDNMISNRNLTRLEDVLFATRQQNQQQRQEEEDSMPELEWGSDHDVNPAEEDDDVNDQNDNRQEHMWHYFSEQRNEEFYRRLEEGASDFLTVSSFQLPDYIRRPNHLQQEQGEEEVVIQEHHEDRVRYVNRRRPLLSNALYEHIASNLFIN
jgi:hypothetical protein